MRKAVKPDTERLQALAFRKKLRVAGNKLSHLIRLGKTRHLVEDPDRGDCMVTKPKRCYGHGRLFRVTKWVPKNAETPDDGLGHLVTSPRMCVRCTLQLIKAAPEAS